MHWCRSAVVHMSTATVWNGQPVVFFICFCMMYLQSAVCARAVLSYQLSSLLPSIWLLSLGTNIRLIAHYSSFIPV